MNERIKLLAEHASLYAVSDNSSMLFDVWKKRYTEKFAELLIRECINIIGEENYTMLTGKAYCVQLKRHFGVEE